MNISMVDILNVNFVLVGVQLLDTSSKRRQFAGGVGLSEITEEEASLNVPQTPVPVPGIRRVSLNRDRITLTMTNEPDRTVIQRDYPSQAELGRLVDIIVLAIKQSSSSEREQLTRHGFNADVVYQLPTGWTYGRFISDHVLRRDLLGNAGYKTESANLRIRLSRNSQTWYVRMEPRMGADDSELLFASLNLDIETNKMPSRSAIMEHLQEIWEQAHGIMGSLLIA